MKIIEVLIEIYNIIILLLIYQSIKNIKLEIKIFISNADKYCSTTM